MSIDREQLRILRVTVEKRRVYTLQQTQGSKTFGTLITPNLVDVNDIYVDEMSRALKKGCLVEDKCGFQDQYRVGKKVVREMRIRHPQTNTVTMWSILLEET